MLYLCDNQALLKVVKRWVGEGEKATLVGAPDADILLEAIKELRKRTTAGAATFLFKVKAHRGKPANERIEENLQMKKSTSKQTRQFQAKMFQQNGTNRAVFTWQEPRRKGGTMSYEDRRSTWNSGVRKLNLKHTVTSTVQASKEWQQQLRLPTTPSGGTCMTACTLHKSQKASSSLSRLTKKVT